MGDTKVKPKAKDDSELVLKDKWVARVLGYEVKRSMDALGVDIPKGFVPGAPVDDKRREAFAEEQTSLIRGQAQRLRTALAAAPDFDTTESLALATGIGQLLAKLDAPKPAISALRTELGQLEQALPAAVTSKQQAALRAAAKTLVEGADKLLSDLPDVGETDTPGLLELKKECTDAKILLKPETLSDKAIEDAGKLLEQARQRVLTIGPALQQLKARRDKIAQRLLAVEKLVQELPRAEAPEVTTVTLSLAAAKNTASKLMGLTGKTAHADKAFERIEGDIASAERDALLARTAIGLLQERQTAQGLDLGKLKVPDDALSDTKSSLAKLEETARTALGQTLSKLNLDQAALRIDEFRKAIGTAATEGADLGGPAGAKAMLDAFGGDQAAADKAFGGRTKLRALAAKLGATEMVRMAAELGGTAAKGANDLASLAQSFDKPGELATTMAALGSDNMAKLMLEKGGAANVKTMCDALSPKLLGAITTKKGPKFANELAAQANGAAQLGEVLKGAGLDGKPECLLALAERGCGGDPKVLGALFKGLGKKELPQLKAMLDAGGLGEAPDAFGALVGEGCAAEKPYDKARNFKMMLASFSDPTTLASVKRALDSGQLKGKAADNGATLVDPATLGHLLRAGHGSTPPTPDMQGRCDSLKTLLNGLDTNACTRLGAMLEKTGLGAAPGAFAGVVGAGCNGDPAALTTVTTTFTDPANSAALTRALTKGGLAGKTDDQDNTLIDPACLGHLLRSGHAPATPVPAIAQRATGLATLLKGLDDPACAKLEGVLSEGGLGLAPRGLGPLLGTGCDGTAANLKLFLTAFDGVDARAGLKRGVLDAGLAGVEDEDDDTALVDPSCLARILRNGHKEPIPPALAPNIATRAAGLATLLTGMDKTACENLNGVLLETGLGLEPLVAGHMVGLGCGGDPVKLAAFADAFNNGPKKGKKNNQTTANQRLGFLIETGGFGSTKADGSPTNTNPECLGRLLGTGCDGKPSELLKLVSHDNFKPEKLEAVMADGELGKHPKVLASLYRNGCLDNPAFVLNGPETGTKNPNVLFDMIGEFSDDPAEFKDLLDNGGLGTASGEHRLGSVVRYAFTPKRPPGGKQDGKKLKTLYDSFSGNMADLKKTVDEIVAAPDTILRKNVVPVLGTEPGLGSQPGQGLQNIISAPKYGGNPAALHQDFYLALHARVADPTDGNPARLTLEELLQNGASFEHDTDTDPAYETISTYAVRTGHVRERHTRKWNTLNPVAAMGNMVKTTLYPRKDDQNADLNARVVTTLANLGANKPANAAAIPLGGPTPGFTRRTGTNDGQGATTQTGFARNGANADVTQFVPEEGGLGCVTINSVDMVALRDALQ